jgi:hypothetical protein
MRRTLLLVVLLAPLEVGSQSSKKWTVGEAKRAADASQTAHRDYRGVALQTFWGDAAFMRACAPPGTPVAAPFDIYFEIQTNGRIGRILFAPETVVLTHGRFVPPARSVSEFMLGSRDSPVERNFGDPMKSSAPLQKRVGIPEGQREMNLLSIHRAVDEQTLMVHAAVGEH